MWLSLQKVQYHTNAGFQSTLPFTVPDAEPPGTWSSGAEQFRESPERFNAQACQDDDAGAYFPLLDNRNIFGLCYRMSISS
jgi:hypothetical protein